MILSSLLIAVGIYTGGTTIGTQQSLTDSVADFPHTEPWILPGSEETANGQVGWLVIPTLQYAPADSLEIEIIGSSDFGTSFPLDTTGCDQTDTGDDKAVRTRRDTVLRSINTDTGDVLFPLCGKIPDAKTAPFGIKLVAFRGAIPSQRIVAAKAIQSPAKAQPLDHPLASGIVVGIFSLIVAFMGFVFNQRLQKKTFQNELAKRKIDVGLEIFRTVDLDINSNLVRLEHFLNDPHNSPQILEQNATTVLHRPEFSDYLKQARGPQYVERLNHAYGEDFKEYGRITHQWGDPSLEAAERNRLRERLRKLAEQLKSNFETLLQ